MPERRCVAAFFVSQERNWSDLYVCRSDRTMIKFKAGDKLEVYK